MVRFLPLSCTSFWALVFTESHNVRGWKGPLWVTQPNPLPKQGHPEQLHGTLSRRGWNISREGDSTASLGSLGQGSVTLRVKKFFLGFRRNLLCFSLYAFSPQLPPSPSQLSLLRSPGLLTQLCVPEASSSSPAFVSLLK